MDPVTGNKSEVIINSNAPKNNMPDPIKKALNKSGTKVKTTPIKKFVFQQPSSDWTSTKPAMGDGNFTMALYKISGGKVWVYVTSIGLPTSSKDALSLVKDCETGFAHGAANHPELTREWIKSGFSASRYSDATKGDVVVWCVSESCKVELKFAFGAGTDAKSNVATADKATNDFLEKNPKGGAQL